MDKIIGLSGPGNDYRHQAIISYIVYALMAKFDKTKKYNDYIALPEFSLKPDSLQVPDITVWKTLKNVPVTPIVLIEICWPKKVADEVQKLTKLMEIQSSILEAFIIDNESLEIKRIYRTKTKAKKPSAPQKVSKIETFKVDLSKFLSNIPVK